MSMGDARHCLNRRAGRTTCGTVQPASLAGAAASGLAGAHSAPPGSAASGLASSQSVPHGSAAPACGAGAGAASGLPASRMPPQGCAGPPSDAATGLCRARSVPQATTGASPGGSACAAAGCNASPCPHPLRVSRAECAPWQSRFHGLRSSQTSRHSLTVCAPTGGSSSSSHALLAQG